jgi:hypothetical protein
LANLAGQMNDFSSSMAPGGLESQWEAVFQAAGLPSSKLSALHVYHRYFYLNTK